MKKILSAITLMAGAGMGGWTPAAYACSDDSTTYIASICAMALTPNRYTSVGSLVLAQGQTLSISQNQALFSLIGTTFGGNGSSTFALPDLRGRVIVGYDPRNPGAFDYGMVGGNATIKLTVAQLPAHALSFNVPVSLSGVSAQTTLTGLNATANLAGVVISGSASGLTMKASSSAGGVANPSGAYLGRPAGAQGAIYTSTVPDATLNAGAIGGNLSLTVGQGVTAPVSISGAASTVLTGNASASGSTNVIGSNADVPIMPPYLALPYYIAVNGIYPPSP